MKEAILAILNSSFWFWMSNFCLVASSLLLLYPSYREQGKAVELPSREIKYGVSWYRHATLIVITLWFISTGIQNYKHDDSGFLSPYITIIWMLLPFLMLIAMPGTIFSSEEGLRQHYWIRRDKIIAWHAIKEIITTGKNRMLTVYSNDGTKIMHTFNYADQARLLTEIRVHCGDELLSEFLKEETDSITLGLNRLRNQH